MEKFKGTVRLIKIGGYESRYNFVTTWINVYKFEDEEGNIYIWKTSSHLAKEVKIPYRYGDGEEAFYIEYEFPTANSLITISASIKGEEDYKGEHQIVLQRVKVIEIVEKALTWEEKQELKRQEQMASLNEGDFIWKRMPYRQYKEHYADCETVAGSFTEDAIHHSVIDVIIREGRLKNSGVRYQHFKVFVLKNSKGEEWQFRAISEENAMKQAKAMCPEENWTLA